MKKEIPLIEECLGHIECGLVEAIEMWLLGEDEEKKPLLHLGGSTYTLPDTPTLVRH